MSDTIDPNDLDSIDALLDEAEQELEQAPIEEAMEEASEAPETPPEPESVDQEEATPAERTEPEPEPDIFDELAADSDDTQLSEPAPIPESVSSPEPEPIRVPDDGIPPKTEPVEPPLQVSTKQMDQQLDPEEILAQRKKKQANSTSADTANNLSVKEMDAIKKLIIIFSSVLIVIGLTTIGLSTWAAISASHKLDEETKQTLEDIKTASNESATGVLEVKKEIKSLHKKLDALSFQLEQLNGDLGNMMDGLSKVEANAQQPQHIQPPTYQAEAAHGGYESSNHGVHDEHAAHQSPTHNSHSPVIAPISAPQYAPAPVQPPVVAKMDPALMKKMREVNRNVIKVQKRIAEINRRIKQLQAQSRGLIKEVKQVQKTVLQSKVAQDKKKKEKKPATSEEEKLPKVNAIPDYIYQAPDYSY